MDINDLRTVMTVVTFVAFIGIVAWAYSKKRKRSFDEAARLPFTGEANDDLTPPKETKEER